MAKYKLNYKLAERYPLVDRENSILYEILIKDYKSVLFVGEGNFSFTLAFAAYRYAECTHFHEKFPTGEYYSNELFIPADTWSGITSTTYKHDMPDSSFVKVNCIASCADYAIYNSFQPDSFQPDRSRSIIELLRVFPNIPADVWLCEVDAENIHPELLINRQVIWFQCPWIPGRQGIDLLVRNYLFNLAEQIDSGVLVCIGITKQFPYIKSYRLESILGKGLAGNTDVFQWYKFLGADDELIQEILRFGYHHQGVKDIHFQIFDDHVTLIFQKTLHCDLD